MNKHSQRDKSVKRISLRVWAVSYSEIHNIKESREWKYQQQDRQAVAIAR